MPRGRRKNSDDEFWAKAMPQVAERYSFTSRAAEVIAEEGSPEQERIAELTDLYKEVLDEQRTKLTKLRMALDGVVKTEEVAEVTTETRIHQLSYHVQIQAAFIKKVMKSEKQCRKAYRSLEARSQSLQEEIQEKEKRISELEDEVKGHSQSINMDIADRDQSITELEEKITQLEERIRQVKESAVQQSGTAKSEAESTLNSVKEGFETKMAELKKKAQESADRHSQSSKGGESGETEPDA